MAETANKTRGVRKERAGTVVSKSGRQTVTVEVERRKQHPRFGKTVRMTKKYHVHDESDAAQVGDKVRIVECRPISRLKRWRMVGGLRPKTGEE